MSQLKNAKKYLKLFHKNKKTFYLKRLIEINEISSDYFEFLLLIILLFRQIVNNFKKRKYVGYFV